MCVKYRAVYVCCIEPCMCFIHFLAMYVFLQSRVCVLYRAMYVCYVCVFVQSF